ncbi:protein NO VEIN domain-containing protein [Pseudomonas sp. NPDC089743]|uniref:protein NO VEIN domain-containing protein n=1 Tax=Pseudomonas sp. NPDC089743 TaxID=3364471 RepID=UPI0037F31623
MSLKTVEKAIVERLAEGDRGDRGWFIITRVHVDLHWLKDVVEYLFRKVGNNPISLTAQDYSQLGKIVGISPVDPGVQLRRHHLLVMDKPLQLIRRTKKSSWREIQLTEEGIALANALDPAEVLERSLDKIRFAVEPWSPTDRVEQYSDFDVAVYQATKQVLARCGGYIHRDEYDFFVSRIRTKTEIDTAINNILEFRKLSSDEQRSLHVHVSSRIGKPKAYSNWRDQALHTFSLFSLGTSMIRKGPRLLLTSNWVSEEVADKRVVSPAVKKNSSSSAVNHSLKIPTPPQSDELLTPPIPPEGNVGAEAESFVAKILKSQGWQVSFFTNKRGYGFDLWARKGDLAMVVEVKSSVASLGQINLTQNEYKAAQHYRANFYLALVEGIGSVEPKMTLIQNPFECLVFGQQKTELHTVSEKVWRAFAE